MKANTLLVVGLVAVGGFIAYKKLGMNTNVNTDPAKGRGTVPPKIGFLANRTGDVQDTPYTIPVDDGVRLTQAQADATIRWGATITKSEANTIAKKMCSLEKTGSMTPEQLAEHQSLRKKLESSGYGFYHTSDGYCFAEWETKAHLAFTGRCFTGNGGLRNY